MRNLEGLPVAQGDETTAVGAVVGKQAVEFSAVVAPRLGTTTEERRTELARNDEEAKW